MEFKAAVVSLDSVTAHENADRLDVARVGGYQLVTRKGLYRQGDLAVYIPEASILPDELLMGLELWDPEKGTGTLAGSKGNRVKAVRLRGVVSQGLLAPVPPGHSLGDDAAPFYGITKYVPEVPSSMNGEAAPLPGYSPHFDVENIQAWPGVLQEGEPVVYTEKIHGTLACYTVIPGLEDERLHDGDTLIASKSMLGRLSFINTPKNAGNLYVRNFLDNLQAPAIWQGVRKMAQYMDRPLSVFGEIFGQGVQDLHYGHTGQEKGFRVFDIHIGGPDARFMDFQEMDTILANLGLAMVPVLYRGPHSQEALAEHRDGRDAISGTNVREGLVITTLPERQDPSLGRVKLKAVSPDYLFRKGNQTEFN